MSSSLYVYPGQDWSSLIYYSDLVAVPGFDRNQAGYLYVLVADHLAARIASGELAPGSTLPAERDLAEAYAVAVGTVRQAVAELRERGLVVTYAAKGTFVAG